MSATGISRDHLGADPVLKRSLTAAPALSISEMTCWEDQRSYRPPACWPTPHVHVVLIRSGGFLRRTNGQEAFIDPTVGYLLRKGDEISVAHPALSRDKTTHLDLSEDVYGDSLDWTALSSFPVSGRLDLCHRALVAAILAGTDSFEITERVHDLLTHLHASGDLPRTYGRKASTRAAHHKMASEVRALLLDGALTASLDELSRHVGCSTFHLSKVFRAVTGRTLCWYRNQLRVRAAAEELADGERLRTLAYKYGFADQAHMTRVFRQHFGQVPTAVRAMVRPVRQSSRN